MSSVSVWVASSLGVSHTNVSGWACTNSEYSQNILKPTDLSMKGLLLGGPRQRMDGPL